MTTAIYMRVSTDKQEFDSQRVALLEYCERRSWPVDWEGQIYTDRISGATASRPGLDALLKDARAGKVQRVVVYALDRLGRSLPHLCLVIEELRRHGVGIVSATQGIDTSTNDAAANLQLNVLAAVCQFEREMIKQRVQAGLMAARARGVKLGRPRLEGKKIARAQELKKEGRSLRQIAAAVGMGLASVARAVAV